MASLFEEYVGREVRRIETPTAMAVVLVVLDGRLVLETGTSSLALGRGQAMIAAPGTPPVRSRHSGAMTCLEVTMSPWVLRALCGRPHLPAGRLWSSEAFELGSTTRALRHLLRPPSLAAANALVGEVAHRAHREVRSEVVWAFHRMVGADGRASVEGLAHDVGWSRRYFTRTFEQTCGLTPKASLGLLRFEAAKRRLVETSDTLADIAQATGYADQSHLTRETRRYAGLTPRMLRRARNDHLPGLHVDP